MNDRQFKEEWDKQFRQDDQYKATVVVAFCIGLVALLGLVFCLAGCGPPPAVAKNYAALAELAIAEYERPPTVTVDDCPCNGTKMVGDGGNAVPCPCGKHCACVAKAPKNPPLKDKVEVPLQTKVGCGCNPTLYQKRPDGRYEVVECPCGANCLCGTLKPGAKPEVKPPVVAPPAPKTTIDASPTYYYDTPRRGRRLFRGGGGGGC